MKQEKVGRFISQCRKEKGMTQAQLAERFGVSNAAVSKWENGRSLPDASIMIELCDLLGITVNELLSGERIRMEDYKEKAESNLLSEHTEKKALKKKTRWLRIGLSITIVICLLIGGFLYKKEHRNNNSIALWKGVIRYYYHMNDDETELVGTGMYLDLISRRYGEVVITDTSDVSPELAEKIINRETWIPVEAVIEFRGSEQSLVSIYEIEPNDYFSKTMMNQEP